MNDSNSIKLSDFPGLRAAVAAAVAAFQAWKRLRSSGERILCPCCHQKILVAFYFQDDSGQGLETIGCLNSSCEVHIHELDLMTYGGIAEWVEKHAEK